MLDVRWPLCFFWWIILSTIFYVYQIKEENLSTRGLSFFCKCPSNSFPFSSLVVCATDGLSFMKTLVTFGFIYATGQLLQNMTKIVCLRWLTLDILNYLRQFFRVFFPHALSKTRLVTQTLYISDTSIHYRIALQILKYLLTGKFLSRTSSARSWS